MCWVFFPVCVSFWIVSLKRTQLIHTTSSAAFSSVSLGGRQKPSTAALFPHGAVVSYIAWMHMAWFRAWKMGLLNNAYITTDSKSTTLLLHIKHFTEGTQSHCQADVWFYTFNMTYRMCSKDQPVVVFCATYVMFIDLTFSLKKETWTEDRTLVISPIQHYLPYRFDRAPLSMVQP